MSMNNGTHEPGTATCRSQETPLPLFRLGQIVATRGVLQHLEHHGIQADPYLRRHVRGDWGDVPPEDALSNERAVEHGARILSSYEVASQRVWVITEADRSVTTLLFPSEY
ncbi:type I restriction-modification system methyltransferase subunit [Burkholderia pseudomallei]|nr:type I restriction-modification system methyltransferase subunit [Burkholderia pseudomallei]